MKKIILSASILMLTLSAKAQGFYVGLDFGYGFGTTSTNFGLDKYSDYDGVGVNESYEKQMYGSVGGGTNFTLTPGYMITKNIGVELGVNYFMGTKYLILNTETSMPEIYEKRFAYSNQLRILPSVIISTGGDKLFGYAKTGLVLPVYGSTKGIVDASKPDGLGGIDKIDVETTTKGNFSLGFRGALGIGYKFTELISLNFEVNYTGLTVKPKSRTMDSYVVNGTEMVDLMKKYDTAIDYIDKIDNTSNNQGFNPNYDVEKPKNELPSKANFNQIGMSLGIKFSF